MSRNARRECRAHDDRVHVAEIGSPILSTTTILPLCPDNPVSCLPVKPHQSVVLLLVLRLLSTFRHRSASAGWCGPLSSTAGRKVPRIKHRITHARPSGLNARPLGLLARPSGQQRLRPSGRVAVLLSTIRARPASAGGESILTRQTARSSTHDLWSNIASKPHDLLVFTHDLRVDNASGLTTATALSPYVAHTPASNRESMLSDRLSDVCGPPQAPPTAHLVRFAIVPCVLDFLPKLLRNRFRAATQRSSFMPSSGHFRKSSGPERPRQKPK